MKTVKKDHRSEAGFTLAEMVIVVMIIGILGTIIASQFRGSISNTARAQALYGTTQKMAQNWGTFTQTFGFPTKPTDDNLIVKSGNNALDILFEGRDFVEDDYRSSYDNSGLKPLADAVNVEIEPEAGNRAGKYKVEGYLIDEDSIEVDGDEFKITYYDVPTDIVKTLWDKHRSSEFDEHVGTDTGRIQHTDAENGVMDMTISLVI